MARVSSKQSRTAAQISSCVTVTISSTSSLQMRKTSGPIRVTAAPSTKCEGSGVLTRWPPSSDCCTRLFSSVSTPITLVDGIICLTVAATPASKDEPPVHTKMASNLESLPVDSNAAPCCRMISRPAVACPAITRGSLCGDNSTRLPFDSSASLCASASASISPPRISRTDVPSRVIAWRRANGTRSGITTMADMPRRCAASASECP
mmetsp:Transcript_24540/g.40658  ORF Transcript_24540/g.40658 Transcript_24540/m.40658 type:complete len:207 (+) Transcript_24540:1059-1679(+)